MNVYKSIERLLQYGLNKQLFKEMDKDYVRNQLLHVLNLDDYEESIVEEEVYESPVPTLNDLLNWAEQNGHLSNSSVTERDLLDTALMGCLTGRPSEVYNQFQQQMEREGIEAATKGFYDFSKAIHYIRTDRIAKNESWFTETEYGNLEITINLSKPEKDPKEIAAAKHAKQANYPKCLLCKENVGFAGRVNHPARQNLRTIPLQLGDENWHLQFSPYVYYNEHAIVFKEKHEPMKITKNTFERLLKFVKKFPHYFLGSNADLPIVGGSILSHDHFQGGKHEFPMAKADYETTFTIDRYPSVKAGIVKWPMSVIRLQGESVTEMTEAAYYIFQRWTGYSDDSVGIHAFSNDTPHNTITPIARKRDGKFELDLVLRNNRTNEEHPDGIFHPHKDVHHIKKENIGLIEVMGLAVLPGRLQEELQELADALCSASPEKVILENEKIAKHSEWALKVGKKYTTLNDDNTLSILQEEVGLIFLEILKHAGVYKRDAAGRKAFRDFAHSL